MFIFSRIGIFDDVTMTTAALPSNMPLLGVNFYNWLVKWSASMIRAKSYETYINLLKLCVEYCGFFPDMVYNEITERV